MLEEKHRSRFRRLDQFIEFGLGSDVSKLHTKSLEGGSAKGNNQDGRSACVRGVFQSFAHRDTETRRHEDMEIRGSLPTVP